VGRVEELDAIEQSLLQTKFDNPQHFIVSGERGIGKTSLLDYVKLLANSAFPVADNQRFNFLTVSVDLGGCSTRLDIVRKLAREFRSEISLRSEVKSKAAGVLSWLSNWEVLGVRYHKPADSDDLDIESIVDDFVDQISVFVVATASEIDGVLILIDEADRPSVDAGLGELVKFLNERLAKRLCYRVLFGLAGLPPLLGKLRDSHQSSPRLFEVLTLHPLEIDERKRVVEIGIRLANEKNDKQTTITDEASELIASLSEGYPHFVQQFAFSAFQTDDDDEIDSEDVLNGAFAENGALSQLGDKFFSEMYHARISSEDYRRVLDAMAEHADNWVSRKTIIKEVSVSESSVTNALRALKDKQIIIQDESQRGRYRLPTRSFAVWINATKATALEGNS
jgi:biotin operon repressor